ncbi:hypothetical protein [Acetobacterium bakii]|uniref:Uncharacterized protein n=1 Tax=Acetobacterium bakii TaxID=52689 RepID=A0A0L6TZA4_9FIRM|nr:hypothetical protein [Acetobacterium bakii]KNZ41397.1 hypothetical protein AKG39_12320 [Acetobacterium bakii]
MNKSQKIWNSIGNESLDALWEYVEKKSDYDKNPELRGMVKELSEIFKEVKDNNLRYRLESAANERASVSLYQGFVLGFEEAVKVLVWSPRTKKPKYRK